MMVAMTKLFPPPFPWFGGKSRAAEIVWSRFGNIEHYIEPFAGSLAVLLNKPKSISCKETVNDLDAFIANFWRASAANPEAVAKFADWPINEADMHSRHKWLLSRRAFRRKLLDDPTYYDAKIAGWWVWGIALWIGSGWCDPNSLGAGVGKRPHLTNDGQGIHRKTGEKRIDLLAPRGVGRVTLPVNQYMRSLSLRLRRTRVCCGDWRRILTPNVTSQLCGIMLDPPYTKEVRGMGIYGPSDSPTVAKDVVQWAIENGDRPNLRIAVCGIQGEHKFPASWKCDRWSAPQGYTSASKAPNKEVIWFSPHCLQSGLW